MSSGKDGSLEASIHALNSRWGSDAIRLLGSEQVTARLNHTPTGFQALDATLSGGIPGGRVTELIGKPTAGLLTLAFCTLAQAQADGNVAVCLDLPQSFEPVYAESCGLNLDTLLLVRPESVQEAASITTDLVMSQMPTVILVDLAFIQLTHQQALSVALRRLQAGLLDNPDSAILFLKYGHSSTALFSQTHLRLYVEWAQWLWERDDLIGYQSSVAVLKNKSGQAGQNITLSISPQE
jgi:hypothetical protein